MDANEQCARALGWSVASDKRFKASFYLLTPQGQGYMDECGDLPPFRYTEAETWADVPDFAADPNLLEDEIERRGLKAEYLDALIDELHISAASFWFDLTAVLLWKLWRATGEQRRAAFLEAITHAS